jgi:hypothetical protein
VGAEKNALGDPVEREIYDKNPPELHGVLQPLGKVADECNAVLIGETWTSDIANGSATAANMTTKSRCRLISCSLRSTDSRRRSFANRLSPMSYGKEIGMENQRSEAGGSAASDIAMPSAWQSGRYVSHHHTGHTL